MRNSCATATWGSKRYDQPASSKIIGYPRGRPHRDTKTIDGRLQGQKKMIEHHSGAGFKRGDLRA